MHNTMICKYCGMESTTSDRCSYCGQSLAAPVEAPAAVTSITEATEQPSDTVVTGAVNAEAPTSAPVLGVQSAAATPSIGKAPTVDPSALRKPAPAMLPKASERAGRMAAPPTPTSSSNPTAPPRFDPTKLDPNQPHVSLSDPLAEHTLYLQNAAQAKQAPMLNAEATDAALAAPGTPVLDPTADAARLAAAGVKPMPPLPPTKPVKKHTPPPDVVAAGTPTALLGRYTIALLLVLLVAAAFAYIGPAFQGIPLVVAQFVGAVLLPVMRLVPWADEDSDDVFLVVLLTIMFGPLVSLLIYAILGAFRGNVNAGLMGCMIVAALSRLDVQLAAHDTPVLQIIPQTMPFSHLAAKFDGHLLVLLLKDWSGLITLAGWYFATVFRKLDE